MSEVQWLGGVEWLGGATEAPYKTILLAWAKEVGASGYGGGYGQTSQQKDVNSWDCDDRSALAAFTLWWNKKGGKLPAPGNTWGGTTYCKGWDISELSDAHKQALTSWADGNGAGNCAVGFKSGGGPLCLPYTQPDASSGLADLIKKLNEAAAKAAAAADPVISKYKGYLVAWSKAWTLNGKIVSPNTPGAVLVSSPILNPTYGDYSGDVTGPWDCFRDGQVLSAFSKWWGINNVDIDVGTTPSSGPCANVLVAELTVKHQEALDKFVVLAFAQAQAEKAVPVVTQPGGETSIPGVKEGSGPPQEKPPPGGLTCPSGQILVNGVCVTAPVLATTPAPTTTKTPWGLIIGGVVVLGGIAWLVMRGGGMAVAGRAENPWYVGNRAGRKSAFSSKIKPTKQAYPELSFVEGPFRTRDGAEHFARVWNSGGQVTQDQAEHFVADQRAGRQPGANPLSNDYGDWHTAGRNWLLKEAPKEAAIQRAAHIKRGRSPNTFRYVVPEWQADAIDALNKNQEERFKAIKLARIGYPR